MNGQDVTIPELLQVGINYNIDKQNNSGEININGEQTEVFDNF